MIKVILYHPGEYSMSLSEPYRVCENVYGIFEILAGTDEFPFRDEASISSTSENGRWSKSTTALCPKCKSLIYKFTDYHQTFP